MERWAPSSLAAPPLEGRGLLGKLCCLNGSGFYFFKIFNMHITAQLLDVGNVL